MKQTPNSYKHHVTRSLKVSSGLRVRALYAKSQWKMLSLSWSVVSSRVSPSTGVQGRSFLLQDVFVKARSFWRGHASWSLSMCVRFWRHKIAKKQFMRFWCVEGHMWCKRNLKQVHHCTATGLKFQWSSHLVSKLIYAQQQSVKQWCSNSSHTGQSCQVIP